MSNFKLALIREEKNPPDKRVLLKPSQCKLIMDKYPNITIFAQPSPIRAYKDEEYQANGVVIKEDVSDCDLLAGIKEVPPSKLVENKNYIFFSHTIKLQKHNKNLLQTVLDKNIKLIDYEVITDTSGKRLIAFGKYAGLVGAYNAMIGLGKQLGTFDLKRPEDCFDKKEMFSELAKVKFPENYKIVMTGDGRVASGALEIIDLLGIKRVSPQEFITESFNEPVYTRLKSKDFYLHRENKDWDTNYFYNNPEEYKSSFDQYLHIADMYIACHYWNPKSDYIFTKDELEKDNFKLSIIADISCDIGGPIPPTIRASTIAEPFYFYDRKTHQETENQSDSTILVMAVDNLPCALPRDASEEFGNAFIENVLPNLIGEDKDDIIARATIAENGKLTEKFNYLKAMFQ